MNKKISKVWTFRSDSNPNIQYETLRFIDGTSSCNCKGWTRRVAADGSRSCKHTRCVDMGSADDQCIATHSYDNHDTQRKEQIHHGKEHFKIPKLGQRKFAV